MSSSEKRTEELADKLVLDIKALVLLHGSEAELKNRLERKVVDSHDESVEKFIKALQVTGKPSSRGLFAMAAGELVLASLLVLAGTIVLVPTLVGISSTGALIQYFAQNLYGEVGNTAASQYASVIEFALGALLMLSAFYTLRQAALYLKESGLTVRPGD